MSSYYTRLDEESEETEERPEDEEESAYHEMEDDFEPLPWHHQQLYNMYGRQADYFLHPKMEDHEQRRVTIAINPRLREEGGLFAWVMLENQTYFVDICINFSSVSTMSISSCQFTIYSIYLGN